MPETRIEYLVSEIQRLQGAIAHLENAGAEIFNNAPPSVFTNEEAQRRRQIEGHPPEIYEKSGEEILDNLRQALENREDELAELRRTDSASAS